MADAAEVLVAWGPGQTRMALVEDGRVVEFALDRPDLLAGALVLGRVVEVARTLDGAFVDIGTDRPAWLQGAKALGLSVGGLITATVRSDARDAKGAVLAAPVALAGRFLTWFPGRPGVTAPRSLDPALVEAAGGLLQPGEGLALRPAAHDPGQVADELARLRADWAGTHAVCRAGRAPAVLWRPHPLLRLLAEAPRVARVFVDDPALLAELRPLVPEAQLLRTGPVFELFDAEDAWTEALSPTVALPGGGRLTIEPTQALTAVDVDSGPANAAEANHAAVAALARQLRLRNIGGQLAVDFVSTKKGRGALAALAAELKQAVAADPVPTHVFGVSPLGLVELTRERRGHALGELLLESGTRPTADTVARAALARVLAEAARRPGLAPALVAAPDVAARVMALAGPLAEVERRLGRPLAVRPDATRTRDDFIIEEA
ncbi:MAG: ribonuclease E/G [Actinomycetota bacterium]